MTFRLAATVVIASLTATSPALAQNGDRAAVSQTGTVPHREIVFTDQLVTSDLPRPDLTMVHGGHPRMGGTLIRTRGQFVQEMFRSVENL